MLLGSPYGEFDKSKGVKFSMKRLSYVGKGVGARVFAVVAVALVYALCNANAQAGLILGTNQLGSKQTIAPNGAVEINLSGFNGRFFGQDVSSIWLAENGYLSKTNVSGKDYFSESLATNTHSRIANFWDDILMFPKPQEPVLKKESSFLNNPDNTLLRRGLRCF